MKYALIACLALLLAPAAACATDVSEQSSRVNVIIQVQADASPEVIFPSDSHSFLGEFVHVGERNWELRTSISVPKTLFFVVTSGGQGIREISMGISATALEKFTSDDGLGTFRVHIFGDNIIGPVDL